MSARKICQRLVVGVGWATIAAGGAWAASMGTAFTYQGYLEKPVGTPVSGVNCDFRFGLWDAAAGGNQKGTSPQTILAVPVDGGVFTATVDFDVNAIDGTARWLAIEVQCTGDPGFTMLAPRVKLTPAPHALALPGLYTQQNDTSPNIIGGYAGNTVAPPWVGATICGGGRDGSTNSVSADYGTIGGGVGNRAGAYAGTVGGGSYNVVGEERSTVAGGDSNNAGNMMSTIGGGRHNNASGPYSTVGGGSFNSAENVWATVGGGNGNASSGGDATVGGGQGNDAIGNYSAVPGGERNQAGGDYSFAAGRAARVRDETQSGDTDGDEGTFVWADATAADFESTGPNQFLVRASGGVGINTNGPTEALDVAGNIHASGTIRSGSSITIDGTSGSEKISSTAGVEIHVAAGRALRIESDPTSPNIIAGYSGNTVAPGVVGATIGGGGRTDDGDGFSDNNRVTDDFGTVGGGRGNRVGNDGGTTEDSVGATVGGGWQNTASDHLTTVSGGSANTANYLYATVGGGGHNIASDHSAVVSGGWYNTASGALAAVGGGEQNTASGRYSVVSGGYGNSASGLNAAVGGGEYNTASGYWATVPGGSSNQAGGDHSMAAGLQAKVRDAATVGDSDGDEGTFVWADATAADFESTGPNQFLVRASGGVGINKNNPAAGALDVAGNILASGTIKSGSSITIDGTSGSERISSSASLDLRTAAGRALRLENNATSPNLIGGYSGNTVTVGALGATVGGGGTAASPNQVTDEYGTVGGGSGNRAGDSAGSTADRTYATVGGGQSNLAGGYRSTVGGGNTNAATGQGSTVGGGETNTARGDKSTIGGGSANYVGVVAATVGGGDSNTANGDYSVVPGGYSNESGGSYSFAAGRRSHVRSVMSGDPATDDGTFIWADSFNGDFVSTGANKFLVRASGGTTIYSNTALNAGVTLAAGGNAWAAVSDRNLKENFAEIDKDELLKKLSAIPITTWNYKSQDAAIRHIGPMGQDFRAAFGVGEEVTKITTIDADGVALAAIQGLYEIVHEKECEIEDLEARLARLEALLEISNVASPVVGDGGSPDGTQKGEMP